MIDNASTLLVVDDIEDNRDLLSRRLKRYGFQTVEATDGLEALDVLSNGGVDLVLLDIMMPNMNGYEVLERMKKDPDLRHIPVIMITAVDDMESTIRCIQLGAEDYLPKPFDSVLLRARVGASLDKKRLRDQEVIHLQRIEEEKLRADSLLNIILPGSIADELKATGRVVPRRYEEVAVMFLDIVGFTAYCDRRHPEEVLSHLEEMVKVFEEITVRHEITKIKTIGDAFMVTANLLNPVETPVLNCCCAGSEMLRAVQSLPPNWNARVGIHIGPVVAGVVGGKQFSFDIWGDTVNTAARVERHGAPGSVSLSAQAYQAVVDQCPAVSQGMIGVKGKGELEIYQLDACSAGRF